MRFNFINNINHPYQKPNSKTVYINKHSNHPPNTLKEPSNTCEEALHSNSLKEELEYENKAGEEQTRHEGCSTRNMKSIVSSHNNQIITPRNKKNSV